MKDQGGLSGVAAQSLECGSVSAAVSGRVLVGVLLICLTLVTMSGCGFHLRGTSQDAQTRVETLYLYSADKFGPLTHALQKRFQQAGTRLTETPDEAGLALNLSPERRSRRAVTTTSEISVAEYEVRLAVDIEFYTLDGSQDKTLSLPRATLYAERVYSFDENSLVGSSEEESLLVEEMRRDLVDQIMRRSNSSLARLMSQRSKPEKLSKEEGGGEKKEQNEQ